MPEPCAPALLPDAHGKRLTRDHYREEFRERDSAIHGVSSWKLERRQHFEEIGNASRNAFLDGDPATSLRLLEERRDAIRAAVADDESRDSYFHRVRIVQEPFTPYLRWQLHSLRLRAECGERIRVVPVGEVAEHEAEHRLPEVVVLGGSVLYQVLYTDRGRPDGAVRYDDAAIVESWESFIGKLYENGEDLAEYFRRKSAALTTNAQGADDHRK